MLSLFYILAVAGGITSLFTRLRNFSFTVPNIPSFVFGFNGSQFRLVPIVNHTRHDSRFAKVPFSDSHDLGII